MGAWTAEPVKIARLLASYSTSEYGSTVIGTRHSSTPEMAAFANGTMFRYLDYNDTYLSKEPAHPSDNLAAILAIADAFDLGGESVILGTIVAYEVQCRLCDAYSIRSKGWDHVTYGAYSTVRPASVSFRCGRDAPSPTRAETASSPRCWPTTA